MKAQDMLIILKVQSLQDQHAAGVSIALPQRMLAQDTGVSLSEVNAACLRLKNIGLLSPEGKVIRVPLLEFLIHGMKYIFPVVTGEVTRGMPTGYAADPLKEHFLVSEHELAPVWPDAQGNVRGIAMEPLYKSVPVAARKDQRLYEYLVLVDAIRGGRARERNKAIEILSERLG